MEKTKIGLNTQEFDGRWSFIIQTIGNDWLNEQTVREAYSQ